MESMVVLPQNLHGIIPEIINRLLGKHSKKIKKKILIVFGKISVGMIQNSFCQICCSLHKGFRFQNFFSWF